MERSLRAAAKRAGEMGVVMSVGVGVAIFGGGSGGGGGRTVLIYVESSDVSRDLFLNGYEMCVFVRKVVVAVW